jgi:hypothetical protein
LKSFERLWNTKFKYFSLPLCKFLTIWYTLLSFGLFFHVLLFCTKTNLATLFLSPAPNLGKLGNFSFEITLWASRCCTL